MKYWDGSNRCTSQPWYYTNIWILNLPFQFLLLLSDRAFAVMPVVLLEGSCEASCKIHQHIEPMPRLHLRTRSLVFFCDAATNSVLIFRKPYRTNTQKKLNKFQNFFAEIRKWVSLNGSEKEEWENSTNFVLIFHGGRENCYEIESDNRKFMVGLSFTSSGQERVASSQRSARNLEGWRQSTCKKTRWNGRDFPISHASDSENKWKWLTTFSCFARTIQENAFADVFSFLRKKRVRMVRPSRKRTKKEKEIENLFPLFCISCRVFLPPSSSKRERWSNMWP